jgi:hypothetical protein
MTRQAIDVGPRCVSLLARCALALLLGGCSPAETTGPFLVATVSVSPVSDTLLVGRTRQFTATTTNAGGQVLRGRPVTWTTSDAAVATVSDTGLVTAVGAGSATVTATSVGKTGTAEVAVPAPVAEVTVSPGADTLLAGRTRQLTATTRDASGNVLPGRAVAWTTGDAAVATVSGAGLVTAVSAGSATIRARSEGKEGTAAVTVKAFSPLPNGVEVKVPATTVGEQQYYMIAVPADRESLVVSVYIPAGDAGFGDPSLFVYTDTSLATLMCSGSAAGADRCRFALPPAGSYAVRLRANTAFAGYAVRATSYAPFMAQSVTAGSSRTCALTIAGAAYCWGWPPLGNGMATLRLVPVPVATRLTFASLSTGGSTCGLTAAGAAYCWGDNTYGEVGDGTGTSRLTPTAVAGGLSFASISAGGQHACGVTTGSAAYCWGANFDGQLGDGTTTSTLAPVPVAGGLAFASISFGTYTTCGLLTSGAAYCWGWNGGGSDLTPVPVAGGLTFASLNAGLGGHFCGLTAGGAAYCWGNNGWGQLGDGTTTSRVTPVPVAGGLTFASLTAGYFHTCGLTAGGVASCWGFGSLLGTGLSTDSHVPVAVAGGLAFVSISAGSFHTCGRITSGAVYCWGDGGNGQLGNGTTTSRPTPWPVLAP